MSSIERAARALAGLDGYRHNLAGSELPVWRDYLPRVHAVLVAVREPTEDMLDAAYSNEHADWETGWRAMIDAAIAEG